MEKEIKIRCKDSFGEWIYATIYYDGVSFLSDKNKNFPFRQMYDPSTVERFTGDYDESGNEIYRKMKDNTA